jgi:hypothetical protein
VTRRSFPVIRVADIAILLLPQPPPLDKKERAQLTKYRQSWCIGIKPKGLGLLLTSRRYLPAVLAMLVGLRYSVSEPSLPLISVAPCGVTSVRRRIGRERTSGSASVGRGIVVSAPVVLLVK